MTTTTAAAASALGGKALAGAQPWRNCATAGLDAGCVLVVGPAYAPEGVCRCGGGLVGGGLTGGLRLGFGDDYYRRR